jgi:hypothetical protein
VTFKLSLNGQLTLEGESILCRGKWMCQGPGAVRFLVRRASSGLRDVMGVTMDMQTEAVLGAQSSSLNRTGAPDLIDTCQGSQWLGGKEATLFRDAIGKSVN